ncbi:unnamed protein product [Prunus armeniaca]|uniref:Uncharacterized protein n=1 Tax=Prunus armeniaca TaxID=36596 RepID=A0A6J5VDR2_PRUAR|nr:unnamed protein product [Prunus armeniaca]
MKGLEFGALKGFLLCCRLIKQWNGAFGESQANCRFSSCIHIVGIFHFPHERYRSYMLTWLGHVSYDCSVGIRTVDKLQIKPKLHVEIGWDVIFRGGHSICESKDNENPRNRLT